MNKNRFHKQTGATLMEVLIAMTISLVVTAAMIAMMSNSLGTTARIIHMTKLQDDLRVAMQMMTRDLRRSNFNSKSMLSTAGTTGLWNLSTGSISPAINRSRKCRCRWA